MEGAGADGREVAPERLRWRCDPAVFASPDAAADRSTLDRIGQPRALKALRLGLEINAPGYHIFVSGLSGSGRMDAVRRLLEDLGQRWNVVPDKAFVHNFEDPTRPRLLELPAGRIRSFATRMDELAQELVARLEALAEDAKHLKRRRRLEEALVEDEERRIGELSAAAKEAGLTLVEVKDRGFTRPSLGIPQGEEVYPFEALRLLVQQGRIDSVVADDLMRRAQPLKEKLDRATVEMRRSARALRRDLAAFDREQARAALKPELDLVAEEFPFDAVKSHLAQVERWLLDHLGRFKGDGLARRLRRRLVVNVILDATRRQKTPIVVEPSPTVANLCGTVEVKTSRSGFTVADHRGIRAGSLLQADGGYLVLKAEDVLLEEGAWVALRRALKFERLEILPRESSHGITLKPQPVPFKVKVVLIGDAQHQALLEDADPDFRKIFKVHAEFDGEMDLTPDNLARFGAYVRRVCQDEHLLPFSAPALAEAAEEAARRSGRGGKLTTRFSGIADLAREANLMALRDRAAEIAPQHVLRALDEAREREDLHDRKMQEQVRDGILMIATEGERVGQVNALTVSTAGKFDFGHPARVTATVAAGDHGILNIEREVQLSGEAHDKGVLILSAFLRERFGQAHPLSLSASICFEQSYGPIDGDSASIAELAALVSALSWVAVRQGVAVTGSVNQKGDLQPVGAVNEKIEGFFDICSVRGLDGTQGVVIPAQNVRDLMLCEKVVAACRAGRFHVWAAQRIDEALELVTGQVAGTSDSEGRYPAGTLNARVADHLWYLAEVVRDFRGANAEGSTGAPAATASGGTRDPVPSPGNPPAPPIPGLPPLPSNPPVPSIPSPPPIPPQP